MVIYYLDIMINQKLTRSIGIILKDIYPLAYPIIRTISKLNYEKLLNKEYFIEVRTDLEELILIYDQNNNYIPPVPGDKIPLKNKSKTKLLKKTKNDQV